MKPGFYNINMFYGAKAETIRAAAILRRNMTLAESILWKKLSDRKLFSIKFRRQHPISFFIVDFYCHELRLVIEVDGPIHDSEESNEYDEGRSAELNNLGIKVIRFTNKEVTYNIESVVSEIQREITQFTPL